MRSLAPGFPAVTLVVTLGVTAGCKCRGSAEIRDGAMEGMTLSRLSPPAGQAPSHPPSSVHSISLPHDEAFAPPGPGRDAFVTACIVCHSPRYITSQPPFSRALWKGLVQKMIDTYGVHITAAQGAEIVDYLVATNGAHLSAGEAESGGERE